MKTVCVELLELFELVCNDCSTLSMGIELLEGIEPEEEDFPILAVGVGKLLSVVDQVETLIELGLCFEDSSVFAVSDELELGCKDCSKLKVAIGILEELVP
jgi:hypothetical protein